MSLTISNRDRASVGSKNMVFFDLAFDSSYPTGGEALTGTNLGLITIKHMTIEPASGYFFEFDYDNNKLKAFYPKSAQAAVVTDEITIAASGAANITDGQSCDVASTFRSAVDAGAGAEVTNAADLSALTTVKCIAYGI